MAFKILGCSSGAITVCVQFPCNSESALRPEGCRHGRQVFGRPHIAELRAGCDRAGGVTRGNHASASSALSRCRQDHGWSQQALSKTGPRGAMTSTARSASGPRDRCTGLPDGQFLDTEQVNRKGCCLDQMLTSRRFSPPGLDICGLKWTDQASPAVFGGLDRCWRVRIPRRHGPDPAS